MVWAATRDLVLSECHAAVGRHAEGQPTPEAMGIFGPMLLHGSMSGSMVLWHWDLVLMSQIHDTTKGNKAVPGLDCHPRHCAELSPPLTWAAQ